MLELNSSPITETVSKREVLDATVKDLRERSVQLHEHSRLLMERSQELNRRIQSYLNSKGTV